MNRHLRLLLLMCSLILVLFGLTGQIAHAQDRYRIIDTQHVNTYKTLNSYNNNGVLHVKNQYKHHNVYVWNKKHTKVLYNLKDFPNSWLL